MDYIFFTFFLASGIFAFIFSRNKRFFDKTVSEYGEVYAKKTFKLLKIGSYFLLVGSFGYLLFFIVF